MDQCSLRITGQSQFKVGQTPEFSYTGIVEQNDAGGWNLTCRKNGRGEPAGLRLFVVEKPEDLRNSDIRDAVLALGRDQDWLLFANFCTKADVAIMSIWCNGVR